MLLWEALIGFQTVGAVKMRNVVISFIIELFIEEELVEIMKNLYDPKKPLSRRQLIVKILYHFRDIKWTY